MDWLRSIIFLDHPPYFPLCPWWALVGPFIPYSSLYSPLIPLSYTHPFIPRLPSYSALYPW
jgi:hypothetical protein